MQTFFHVFGGRPGVFQKENIYFPRTEIFILFIRSAIGKVPYFPSARTQHGTKFRIRIDRIIVDDEVYLLALGSCLHGPHQLPPPQYIGRIAAL